LAPIRVGGVGAQGRLEKVKRIPPRRVAKGRKRAGPARSFLRRGTGRKGDFQERKKTNSTGSTMNST